MTHSALAIYVLANGSDDSKTGFFQGELFKSLIAPAAIALLVSGLIAYLLERLKSKREAVIGLNSALRAEIEALSSIVTAYWSRDAKADDAIIEAEIMARLAAVSTGLQAFQANLKLKLADDLTAWMLRLRLQITDGGFQLSDRKADPDRIQAVSTQLARMRYRLFIERLKRI